MALQEYKCPCCGGSVEFNSTVQKMKCPYCDTEFEMDALKEYDATLDNEQDQMDWDLSEGQQWSEEDTESLRTYVCKSCGGEIIGEATTAAMACPYCGNTVVMMGQLSGSVKPDYVIPFKLDKKAAKEKYFQHLEGKKLLPKIFKDENHIDEIKGVYVPFWFFDTTSNGSIRYKATKVRTWEDKFYRYKETSYFGINREGTIEFENVPADGSKKMPDDLSESIEPYDFSDAVDFQTAYLAGYVADKYDVEKEDCLPRINERIKNSTQDAFRKTITGYNTVDLQQSRVVLSDSSAKYVLCPVWLLNTTWNDEKYTFAMNGQTGKFVGNLPCDKGAFWKYFGIITAIGTAVAYVALNIIENM